MNSSSQDICTYKTGKDHIMVLKEGIIKQEPNNDGNRKNKKAEKEAFSALQVLVSVQTQYA
ncbi:MAG TPA: hypothetical protein DDW86_05690 [Clostridiales bacterium]|jgi:hypothetical protein|nr:hypothetical protein [Clostridiales bacterium]